jgi:Ca2+-binding EF-hand superfamily protein
MDTVGSGDLNKAQMVDAFYALGVGLADDVVGQIMEQWGGGEELIKYQEFLGALFPDTGKQ